MSTDAKCDSDNNYEDEVVEYVKKKPKVPISAADEEIRKEMHRKCESRRRERINQYYDQLFDLIKDTALIKTKGNAKMDRCSLIRFTNSYMKEIGRNVNSISRLLCKIASNKPDLIRLFPPAHLQFILQSEYVDDDVCLLLASCFNHPYTSQTTTRYSSHN